MSNPISNKPTPKPEAPQHVLDFLMGYFEAELSSKIKKNGIQSVIEDIAAKVKQMGFGAQTISYFVKALTPKPEHQSNISSKLINELHREMPVPLITVAEYNANLPYSAKRGDYLSSDLRANSARSVAAENKSHNAIRIKQKNGICAKHTQNKDHSVYNTEDKRLVKFNTPFVFAEQVFKSWPNKWGTDDFKLEGFMKCKGIWDVSLLRNNSKSSQPLVALFYRVYAVIENDTNKHYTIWISYGCKLPESYEIQLFQDVGEADMSDEFQLGRFKKVEQR